MYFLLTPPAQVDPVFHRAWIQRLKLKYDELQAFKFCFQCQLALLQGWRNRPPPAPAPNEADERKGLMDSARHVINRTLNPRCLSQMSADDMASTILQSHPLTDSARHVIKRIRSRIQPSTLIFFCGTLRPMTWRAPSISP